MHENPLVHIDQHKNAHSNAVQKRRWCGCFTMVISLQHVVGLLRQGSCRWSSELADLVRGAAVTWAYLVS